MSEERPQSKSHWSPCGAVFFTGGYGWGIAPNGDTVSLGKEEAVKRYLKTGEMSEDITMEATLEEARKGNQDEQSDRTIPAKRSNQSGVRKASSQRSRPMLDTRRRPADNRRPAHTKRIPLRLS